MPEDLYYDEHHFWLKKEAAQLVMGLDDFGQQLAQDIVYIQMPPEGKRLVKGKVFAKMESGKWVGKIYAPVNGTLAEINEELELEPGLINDDCYGEGWIYKIDPDDMSELDGLIYGSGNIEQWLREEIEKYRDN